MLNKRTFGRRRFVDQRDEDYRLRAPSGLPSKPWRYWYCQGWWGNQDLSAACVGFSWVHWLEDGPVTHKGPAPILDPYHLYREAQTVDEWEGEEYEGTSVRAGAKILKKLGYIEQYRWAPTIKDVIYALLYKGPIVVGTWWYEGMTHPDHEHRMHLGGFAEGGHAYVLNGINIKNQRIRVKNSWGREWGKNGQAFIAVDDMARLLEDEGEACLAIERRP